MRESYLDYAMSVITSRALPDVRDGLKPVHRRILYAMHRMGLTPAARFRKSAAVVGDVLGKYHPHGDASVYDAMVKMAQDFAMRYPLVIGQGNFGSIDGDSAAAMRYTEAKMSRHGGRAVARRSRKRHGQLAPQLRRHAQRSPRSCPRRCPTFCSTARSASRSAWRPPSRRTILAKFSQALTHLIENPDATVEDLMQFVTGPDFPTGAVAFNKKDLLHAYSTGKGGVVVRGVPRLSRAKKATSKSSSPPSRTASTKPTSSCASPTWCAIKRSRASAGCATSRRSDIRIVVDLKQGAHPQKVLNYLYKHTALEDTFHFNMVVLVDGVPQTLSLKGILQEFIKHRKEVVQPPHAV